MEEIRAASPEPGRGKEPARAEEALRDKAARIEQSNRVEGLLEVAYERHEPQPDSSALAWRSADASSRQDILERARQRLSWQRWRIKDEAQAKRGCRCSQAWRCGCGR